MASSKAPLETLEEALTSLLLSTPFWFSKFGYWFVNFLRIRLQNLVSVRLTDLNCSYDTVVEVDESASVFQINLPDRVVYFRAPDSPSGSSSLFPFLSFVLLIWYSYLPSHVFHYCDSRCLGQDIEANRPELCWRGVGRNIWKALLFNRRLRTSFIKFLFLLVLFISSSPFFIFLLRENSRLLEEENTLWHGDGFLVHLGRRFLLLQIPVWNSPDFDLQRQWHWEGFTLWRRWAAWIQNLPI